MEAGHAGRTETLALGTDVLSDMELALGNFDYYLRRARELHPGYGPFQRVAYAVGVKFALYRLAANQLKTQRTPNRNI